MKNSEILTQARKLIENEENWTHYNLARDPSSKPVDPTSPDAVCFCSVGAVAKVTNTPYKPENDQRVYNCGPVRLLSKAVGILTDFDWETIWIYNDNATSSHESILAVFDKAIELAKAQESK